jgi:cyclic beta-1,2-glucan synthetase
MLIVPQVILSEPTALGVDLRLREFAHRLAKTHEIETAKISHPKETTLLEYLEGWELALRNAYSIFKTAPSKDGAVSRAGEWMLDNFYVVKQTIRQIEEDLPYSFLTELPKLSETSLQGHTRIFALAREWIGYSQGHIDLGQAAIFVQDYQQVMPLTIGELWALPIMLRIGILERLVYATSELTGIEVPNSLSEVPNQFAVSLPNDTIVANCFLSLRLLSATDWKDFFEQTSRVEQILRDDPAQIYADMDFDTRNNYRSVIEELARHSKHNEEQVALAAVEFARNAEDTNSIRKSHVGFYLIDAGRATLENSVSYKPGIRVRVQRVLLAFPTATYLGSIAMLSVLFVLGLLTYARISGGSPIQLIIAGVLGLGLAFEAAITIVHWDITHRIKPQSLPRMDFS